jgi:hypothetical protein
MDTTMDTTQSARTAAAARTAQSVPQSDDMRAGLRHNDHVRAAAPGAAAHKSSGYGLPCSKCRLYYPADLDSCPTCDHKERVSPNVVPAQPKSQAAAAAAEPAPDVAVVEQEREAFLAEFKSQLFAAHAEVASAPVACALGEHQGPGAESASVCRPCYERLQERVDIFEAAMHMDLKEAAQIVYDAVWADPSEPSKTYTNAAGALLSELRKRSGVSPLVGPFQPLGN